MISHIKNISMGLWPHKEKTHIQYPNMYKLYVSCNYLHKDSFFFVPATQTLAQCNSRSSDASAEPGRAVRMIIYSPITWETCECF